jgi:hypothetical protein
MRTQHGLTILEFKHVHAPRGVGNDASSDPHVQVGPRLSLEDLAEARLAQRLPGLLSDLDSGAVAIGLTFATDRA